MQFLDLLSDDMDALVERLQLSLKTAREKGGSFHIRIEARPSTQEIGIKLFTGEGQFGLVSSKQFVIQTFNKLTNEADIRPIVIEMEHIVRRQGFGSIHVEVEITKQRAIERIVGTNEYRQFSFVARVPN
jgi:hypothetical protein